MAGPNYKHEYESLLKKNLEDFNIKESDIKEKIAKHAKKFSFSEEKLTIAVQNDVFLKSFFIKEPSKQNLYEKTFGDFLKGVTNVINFNKLPNSGNDAIFIVDQKVWRGEKADQNIKNKTKSMDFEFEYKGLDCKFYVFHKFTKGSGGAQDNQKNDVIKAIQAARAESINSKIIILFVCDGDYYDNNKVFQEMQKFVTNDNIKLLKSSDIEDFLKNKSFENN